MFCDLSRRTQCTVRVPRLGMDEMESHKDQRHIVIYRKGVYFKLDAYKTDSDGKEVQVSVPELYTLLQQIVEMAEGISCDFGALFLIEWSKYADNNNSNNTECL